MELPMAKAVRGRGLYAAIVVCAALSSSCRFAPQAGSAGALDVAWSLAPLAAGAVPESGSPSREADVSHRASRLASDAWVRDVSGDGDDRYRWRHLELEPLSGDTAFLASALQGTQRRAAVNAAILLARLGDDRGGQLLAAALHDAALRPSQRCAAAEAIGLLAAGDDALRAALARCSEHVAALATAQRDAHAPPAEPATMAARRWSAYDAALHAQLVRSVAQRSDPADDAEVRRWLYGSAAAAPSWLPAIAARDAEVRLAALEAWSRSDVPLPDEALVLQDDPDPRVRAELLRRLVGSGHPQAVRIAVRAVKDAQFPVSRQAMAALAMLSPDAAGRDEAIAALRQAAEDAGEGRRAAAIEALARLGDEATVLRAADDSRWVVRRSVARALKYLRGPEAAEAARRLVRDASAVVRGEAVSSLAYWPLQEAGPIWLEVLGGDALQPRIDAARQLAARWQPAAGFPLHGDAAQRATRLEELRALWTATFGTAPRQSTALDAEVPPSGEAERHQVETYLRGRGRPPHRAAQDPALRAALLQLGPALPELLWQAVQRTAEPLPEELFQVVLPQIGAEYAALQELESEDVAVRRRGADRLWALAGQQRLPPLVLHRLMLRMAYQSDALVWRSVQLALADDNRPEARYVAHAGLTHPHPEVRRRACEHLQRHGEAADAPRLAALLDDADPAVRLAAVRALGHCGTAAVAPGLERLLASESPVLRAAAAESLMHCDPARGTAALRRLTYDRHADVRRQAAEAMGRHGQGDFVDALLRLLDDELEVRRAALRSLVTVVGYDAAAEVDPASTTDENRQIAAWKRWYQRSIEPAGGAAAAGGITNRPPPVP
jgi:HEAT repeat protein